MPYGKQNGEDHTDIRREGAGSKFLLIKRVTTSKPTLSLKNEISIVCQGAGVNKRTHWG